jgi:hypothetical protein
MSTAQPQWGPAEDETYDLLSLVADPDRPVGRDAVAAFVAACERDARHHGGDVSVNRVRALLAHADIPPRRLSALWAQFTGEGRLMRKTGRWESCAGSTSGNDGRPFPIRRWTGGAL